MSFKDKTVGYFYDEELSKSPIHFLCMERITTLSVSYRKRMCARSGHF